MAIAAVLWLQARTHQRLAEDWSDLSRQHQEMVRLQGDNERLNTAIGRLDERRKSQIKAILAAPAPAAATVPAPVDPDAKLAAEFISLTDLKNAGIKTPKDAFETYLWALDRLDVPTLARLLHLNESSSQKIHALYASLPPADQTQYGSAEEMFAAIYASEHPIFFSAVQISADESQGSARGLTLNTQYEYSNGHITEHHDVRMVPAPDGSWQMALFPGMVDHALKQLDEKAPAASGPKP